MDNCRLLTLHIVSCIRAAEREKGQAKDCTCRFTYRVGFKLLRPIRTVGKVPGNGWLLAPRFFNESVHEESECEDMSLLSGKSAHQSCSDAVAASGRKHNGAYSRLTDSRFEICYCSELSINKRFAWGTAQQCGLPAPPGLLRQVRLKLWLRNYFPGRRRSLNYLQPD